MLFKASNVEGWQGIFHYESNVDFIKDGYFRMARKGVGVVTPK